MLLNIVPNQSKKINKKISMFSVMNLRYNHINDLIQKWSFCRVSIPLSQINPHLLVTETEICL